MNFDLIIEPGIGVGLVKFGMTRPEVEALGVDLSDDRFRMSFDSEGRCDEIEVLVYNNPQPVLLNGRDLNNISKDATEAIFLAMFGSKDTDREDLGIRCLEWELSDKVFTFVEVSRSKDLGNSA